MKKFFLLLFICLTQTTFSFSQTKDKGSISLSFGPAFPLGKFASKEFSDELAGFAKTGQAFSLSYTKLISKTLGIALDLQGQRNPIDTKELGSSFAQAFAPYPTWKVDKEAWLQGALLLGGMGQFALKEATKVSLTTKAMIGALYASTPGLKGSSVNGTDLAFIEQSKKAALGFVYCLSAGVNHEVNERFFFTSLLTYKGTPTMTYKDIRTTLFTSQGSPGSPDHAVQQAVRTMDGKQAITAMNVLIGVGIRL